MNDNHVNHEFPFHICHWVRYWHLLAWEQKRVGKQLGFLFPSILLIIVIQIKPVSYTVFPHGSVGILEHINTTLVQCHKTQWEY